MWNLFYVDFASTGRCGIELKPKFESNFEFDAFNFQLDFDFEVRLFGRTVRNRNETEILHCNYNRAIEKIEIKRNKFIIYGYLLINGRNKCLEY